MSESLAGRDAGEEEFRKRQPQHIVRKVMRLEEVDAQSMLPVWDSWMFWGGKRRRNEQFESKSPCSIDTAFKSLVL